MVQLLLSGSNENIMQVLNWANYFEINVYITRKDMSSLSDPFCLFDLNDDGNHWKKPFQTTTLKATNDWPWWEPREPMRIESP